MRALRRLAMKKPAVSSSSSTHKPPSPVLAPGYEENPQNYRPGGYHPVVLGTVFRDGRYHVTRKLGFGVYSTVWLCRDKQ